MSDKDHILNDAQAEPERLPTHGNLLAEINKAAHAAGTNAWVRDVLKQAHRAIRLNAPLAAPQPASNAKTWEPVDFWKFVSGLAGEFEADQMRDMLAQRGLQIGAITDPAYTWQDISTAPKNKGFLIDLWTVGWGADPHRVADCYYDQICDEWRTSRPAGQVLCIKARYVTHWMRQLTPPVSSTHRSPPADPTGDKPSGDCPPASAVMGLSAGGVAEIAAAKTFLREKPSTSYIQRKMGIGYNHAMRLMEALEDEGFISRPDSTGRRTVLVSSTPRATGEG